jgi:hypothetical protein
MPVPTRSNILALGLAELGALTERFEQYVRIPVADDACWEWTASRDKKGYGCFSVGDFWAKAHRVSYELYVGPITFGMYVLHRCDNPACVNPDHLLAGTAKQNTHDMWAKNRAKVGQRLTPDQVAEIRASTEPQKVLSKRYGVSQGHISHVKTGNRGTGIMLSSQGV